MWSFRRAISNGRLRFVQSGKNPSAHVPDPRSQKKPTRWVVGYCIVICNKISHLFLGNDFDMKFSKKSRDIEIKSSWDIELIIVENPVSKLFPIMTQEHF